MTGGPRPTLAGRRVLVAEDEFLNAILLEDMLAELGIEMVGPIAMVDEIVAAAERERPDAAALDINLRGETSYAAASALRDSGIAIVFVSGYDELPDCPPHLLDVPRVRKPISTHELMKALEQALS